MEFGTLAKAADYHCLSVSAASRQISVLEDELGMPLFTRHQRNLIPTVEGNLFYKKSQRILNGLNELPVIAQNIRQEQESNLRLITVPRAVRHIVSPAVATMYQDYPDMNMHIDVQAMRYIQRWIADFRFNLGIGRLPIEHPGVIASTFCSLPTVVALHPEHRLAYCSELTLSDLEGEPMIGLLKDTLLGKNTADIFAAGGHVVQPVVEVASSFQACSIVASGFGYTIGDPLSTDSLGEGQLALVPLKTDFRFEFAFIEPVDVPLSPSARLFKEYVREATEQYLKQHDY